MKRLRETRDWVSENAYEEVYQRFPYSAVRVAATWKGKEYYGLGFSKCRAGDTWDNDLGITIARGRAELDLAQQINMVTLLPTLAKTVADWQEKFFPAVGKAFCGALALVTRAVEVAAQPELSRVDEFPPREKEEER